MLCRGHTDWPYTELLVMKDSTIKLIIYRSNTELRYNYIVKLLTAEGVRMRSLLWVGGANALPGGESGVWRRDTSKRGWGLLPDTETTTGLQRLFRAW